MKKLTTDVEEAEFEDSGKDLSISLAEVSGVVKKLLCGKARDAEGSGYCWAVMADMPF